MGGSHGSDDCTAEVSHISLCAGYGGIDLGLAAVVGGLRTVAYVEIEAFAVANLVAKMEAGGLDAAPVYTDLHAFPFDQFHGCVDILTGGFPCQPFSISGNRLAEEDPRHLWPAIARGIAACRPTVVFMENVEGITTAKSAKGHSVLHHVLVELEGLGYRATAGIFSAEECGAPHRRRRIFIAGLADPNRDSCQQGEPRRADRELPEASQGLRAGASQRQAGEVAGDCGSPVADTGCGDCDEVRIEWKRAEKIAFFGSIGKAGRIETKEPAEAGMWSLAARPQADGADDDCSLGWCPRSGMCIEECNECTAGELEQRSGGECGIWPAARGEPQYEWEPPRVLECELGGMPDGGSGQLDRIDRLRLLGNGVVPATAARAFTVLMGRLLLLGMLLWPRLWLLLAPDALEAARSVLA